MLKLADGSQITEEIKEAFKRGIVKQYLKLKDNTIIDNNNYLQKAKLEELRYHEDNERFIGEAVAKRVTVNIYNENNEIDLEDKEFEYFEGAKLSDGTMAWINHGTFLVQKPENNDTKEKTEFQALDNMCKLNQPYKIGVTLPCTLAEFANDACSQCGVELGHTNFRNANFMVYENPFINNETCRTVIKEVAKIAFSWARIVDDKIYFDFTKKSETEVSETFTLDDYVDLSNNNKTIPINTIILKASNIEGENITIKDENLIEQYGVQKELVIEEDYFAYNQEIRQQLIEAGRALMGLTYTPIEINSIGTVYLDSNDYIKITDRNGNFKYSYCINHTSEYNGTLYDSISCPAMTETESKYQNETSEELEKRRTEIAVNKSEQKINAIVEEVTEQTQKITDLQLDVNGMKSLVSLIADTVNNIESTTGKITINDAIKGELLELHIYGNNTVFDSLKLSDDLYLSDETVIYGDSFIKCYTDNLIKTTPEGYEQGKLNSLGNVVFDSPLYIVTKDFIEFDKTCYLKVENGYSINTIYFYDKDFQFLSSIFVNEANYELQKNTSNYHYFKVAFNNSELENITTEDVIKMKPMLSYTENLDFVEYNTQIIDLGIDDVLRQLGNVKDEYVLKDNKAKIIRRIGITESGVPYILSKEEEIPLEAPRINLEEGTNYIDILNYIANIKASYVVLNDFTKVFTTDVEFQSIIEQLYNSIKILVSEKVGEDEIIAAINLAIENEQGVISIKSNLFELLSDYTQITKEGRLTTTEGNIANFELNENGFFKDISGTYSYQLSDVTTLLEYIRVMYENPNFLPNAIKEIYDMNSDGELSVVDAVRMLNVIKGTAENTKIVNGRVEINSNDPANTFYVGIDDIVKTSIGLFTVYSYLLDCQNFRVGEYVNGTFVGITMDKDSKKMYVTNGNKRVVVGMEDETGRCVLQSQEKDTSQSGIEKWKASGSIVAPGNNIEAVNFIAGGTKGVGTGTCMHGTNLNNEFACGWDGSQYKLSFYVDAQNVGSLSDGRLKTDISEVSEDLLKAIEEVEIKSFILDNRKEIKSFGIIAQELIEIFKNHNLNINDYGLVAKTQYNLTDKTLYYMVDYEQLLILKVKCLEKRNNDQQKQIDFLVNKLNCKNELEKYMKGE